MHPLVNILGIAGNIAFGWACCPTAYHTVKAGKSIGTPIGLAWNILIACVLFYMYTFLTYTKDPIVWACGVLEIGAYVLVIWYHYFPRKR